MQRTLDANFDEIVIGANLSALSYAYNKKLPVIYTRLEKPLEYPGFRVEEHIQKYNKLIFLLSMNTLVPYSYFLNNLRIESDNILKASTKTNILVKINYNKLTIFDDYNLEGLPPSLSKTNTNNLVIDTFSVYSREFRKKRIIKYKKDPVDTIHLYDNFFKTNKENCFTISYIDDKNLDKFEFSETAIKIDLLNFLNRETNKKVLTHYKRIIHPLGKNLYENYDNINFLYNEEQVTIQEIKGNKKFYG